MSSRTELTSEQRDNLVAYLDGELNEGATNEIEQLLANSAEARAEVERLSTTWNFLDDLAQPKASPGFSEKTLATVKIAEVQAGNGSRWSVRARRGAVTIVWIAALVLSAGIGFMATHHWIPNPATTLSDELPLIESLHIYSEVETVDFLTQLKNSKLFDDQQTQTSAD